MYVSFVCNASTIDVKTAGTTPYIPLLPMNSLIFPDILKVGVFSLTFEFGYFFEAFLSSELSLRGIKVLVS